jgi:hypothetical protein
VVTDNRVAQPETDVVRRTNWLRVATFVAILAVHGALLALFPAMRGPSISIETAEWPTVAVFLPLNEPALPTQPSKPDTAGSPTRRSAPSAPVAAPSATSPQVTVPREPTPQAITTPAAPDWRQEARIAANDVMEGEERRRRNPSPLAPHDFSSVPHGAVDVTKPQFRWSHAATHRLESLPEGGFLVNINDRCVIAVYGIPMLFCRIGKIPTHSDLFEHMADPPAPQPTIP